MKQTIETLLATTTDRRVIKKLKEAAVLAQQYELASEIRTIETDRVPLTDEEKSAHKIADQLNVGTRLLNYNISRKGCWELYQLMKLYTKKKGRVAMDDTAKIQASAKLLFPGED